MSTRNFPFYIQGIVSAIADKTAEQVSERVIAALKRGNHLKTTAEPLDHLIDMGTVMSALNLSRSAVYRLIEKRNLTPIKIDSKLRFRRADIEAIHRGEVQLIDTPTCIRRDT